MISRILIVGLGSIGKRHLRLAREMLPLAEIGVLRHKADSTLPEGADHIFSSIVEALKFSPQIAVIANPATLHLSVAMPLAKAGVHLLIEKPLSDSVVGVDDLLDTCRNINIVLATGYNLRYLPCLQKFKSMLDEGVLGDLYSVRSEAGQYLPSWRPGTDYRQSVSAQRALGGGALLELSHEIDYLQWIFGDVSWVQASISKQSDLEIDVEDTVHLIVCFSPKMNKKPLISSLSLDLIRSDKTRVCTAIGEKGNLRWNGIAGTIESLGRDERQWQEVFRRQTVLDESYRHEWKDFISSIEQNTRPAVSGEDGLNVLRVIEATRQAANVSSRVHLKISHTVGVG